MKKFSAIFLATLLTLNIVASLRLNPIDASILPSNSIRSKLAQILIQVKEPTANPTSIRVFVQEIEGMLSKLQEEQKKHQEISDKMMKECTEEDEFRKKEVADATDAHNRSQRAREKCEGSLASANKDLPDLKSAKENYEDQLHKAQEQRDKEHKLYQERKRDYEEAIAFLNDFTKYVSVHFKGSFKSFSFVEKSELLLRHATKLARISDVVPILIHLAQAQGAQREPEVPTVHNEYKYTANDSAANTLKSALDKLLATLQKDHDDNEETEKKQAAAFQKLKEQLEAAIHTLKNNIERTEQQIKDMAKCVAEEEVICKTAEAKLQRNSTLKSSAEKMCQEFAKEFTTATLNRLEEIKTIQEIMVIVQNRFGKLAKDLVTYLENTEKSWTAYCNSTEFKKFVEYQQHHGAVNEHGANLVAQANLLH